ncbi:hypothetical protein [Novosphingobium sp.]|uniref:hypothetical protein n=1 Tax=Novosphingobium sp. TaxID=1874826 RepID=UPI002FDD6BC4
MALKSNNTAVALAIQVAVDAFTAPTTPADLMPVSNLKLDIAGVTLANDEYTGSPFKNADTVAGKKVTLSYTIKLRPPGGVAIPAANAFLLGRVLQAAKFTELRTSAAIPVAPEALSAGSTTGATLGAGAAATADLYKGMAISLAGMGTSYKERMSALRSYASSKVVAFVETFGSPVSGNYQIPSQISYMRDVSSADPILLSQQVWLDGHRFDLLNCRVTQMQIQVPTSTKDQAAYPEMNVTFDATISANSEQATPAVPPAGTIPLYKDGDGWLAGTRVGLRSFTLDLGVQTENPPNPNKVDGVDAAELVGGVAKVSMVRQKYRPSTIDTLALADAQAYQPFFAQWGSAAGALVQIVVPDGRLNYQNPDLGGNIIMESGDLLIDALARGVCINFPY